MTHESILYYITIHNVKGIVTHDSQYLRMDSAPSEMALILGRKWACAENNLLLFSSSRGEQSRSRLDFDESWSAELIAEMSVITLLIQQIESQGQPKL